MAYLSLTLNSLAVTIDTFLNESYPRLLYAAPSIEYSQYRTLIKKGLPFVPPEQWVVSCLLTPDNADLVEAIYQEHLRLRRLNLEDRILTTDTTWKYKEVAPRTKAVAPSPYDAVLLFGVGDTHVKYFARFYTIFSAQPTFTESGDKVACSFSLAETDEVVAP